MTQTVATNPEIGRTIDAAGIRTNYHDHGTGEPVLLIHGSGPGVSAWANWRGVLPELAAGRRVLAPDIVGFGYTERPAGFVFSQQAWVDHLVAFLDALDLPTVSVVGNSFGGALALWLAGRHPERVAKLVLMGSAGTRFDLTPGLDAVWGYQPSVANMARLLELFAYDQSLLSPDLARLRYEASIRAGVHESYSAMFPAPRQAGVDALALPEDGIRALPHETLIVHGREDKVIPLSSSLRLAELIERAQLHVFGQCGHWAQIEKRAEFVHLLRGFLPA
ncbi:alpha/beta fold hydrolase [Amycolatopsis pithecellobii]|uniref:Alpha/beta fold hydrolase n=1 Tax=Amycolatopsis pithecellobii TaxID=664692 RepID=A0A6N7Z117_9PSEU|nr:alpha/beta fold hydrolase [Amycolatopsis pithecellobii]MTD54439.1 alpha/beta fold hydrolase [Amycolatopsis pithecellobii]